MIKISIAMFRTSGSRSSSVIIVKFWSLHFTTQYCLFSLSETRFVYENLSASGSQSRTDYNGLTFRLAGRSA